MQMDGVSSRYHPGESTVLALKAGVDLVLMPEDADVAIDAIVDAVRRGELTTERIDHSLRKLLAMKQWVGLDRERLVDIDKVASVVGSPDHRALAKEVAERSITVLGNASGLLPLSHTDTSRILDLVIADTEDPDVGRQFHWELRKRHRRLSYERIDPHSNQEEYDTAMAAAARADRVILQLHFYTRSGQMTGFIPDSMRSLIKSVIASGVPTIGISFGNPYVVTDFPELEAYVCTYSSADVVTEAAAEVLFAEEAATGKLPITIPGVYSFGEGVEYPKTVLRQGNPAEAGFDPRKLGLVDEVVHEAVRDSAFPGAVVLVARNGVVVHERAYGAYDYAPYAPIVQTNSIFDLASVTKVIATTSAVMRLLDERKLSLSDPVVRYLPAFGQGGKDHITIYNLLVHNSGLPAWRKFYEFCETPQCVLDSIYATSLIYPTGDSTLYSDLGLITTGKIIERITGSTLDRFVDSVFFTPLGMRNTFYNPPERVFERIVPTEVDTYWKKTGLAVRGRVHDENAATLGGVSGHAGLFSTASDLAIFLQMLLNDGVYDGVRYLAPGTIRQFTERQSETSSRAIGWDTKSPVGSFAGEYAALTTFLHTGFTGTSVVADRENGIIVIFLTNRVNPTRETRKIFRVRPAVHNAIYRALRDPLE
jgi:beta-N-acetylhexosaminidase